MKARILLIDDEPKIREVLSWMLMMLGYEVATASGQDEAIALVGREQFSLAFVDNQLGSARGIDLVKRLIERDPDLCCILMSGNPSIGTAQDALQNGISSFLRKPFRVEELMVSIEQANMKKELDRQRKELQSGQGVRER